MALCFDPKTAILPQAQREIWPELAPAPRLSFVLYGGTAVALHLGHRQSIDFDFFRAEALNKRELESAFNFVRTSNTVQEEKDLLVVTAKMPSGFVMVSFFGGIGFGRLNDPLSTSDSTLLVASLEDLLATKLKAILDRAEAKDYRDIAEMLSAGISLERGLAAFSQMFGKDPGLPLKALGYFKDGDLPTLANRDQKLLRGARDRVVDIPKILLTHGSLAVPLGECTP